MDEHDITRHNYGGKVEISCKKFVTGLIELFDDLADFALSRLYKRFYSVNSDFDVEKLPPADVDHFKLKWYVALRELMFFNMADQARLEDIKEAFYAEMELTAADRKAAPFLIKACSAIPKIITRNIDFFEREMLSRSPVLKATAVFTSMNNSLNKS